jgi:hypothetical protein
MFAESLTVLTLSEFSTASFGSPRILSAYLREDLLVFKFF